MGPLRLSSTGMGRSCQAPQKTGGSPHPIRGEDPAPLVAVLEDAPRALPPLQHWEVPRVLQGLQTQPQNQCVAGILPWDPSIRGRGMLELSWPRNEGSSSAEQGPSHTGD